MTFNSLSSFVKNTNKALNTATFRAMNKTASKLNTKFKKAMSSETGITSKIIAKRFRIRKATKNSFKAGVSFGTKYGINLENFKPKIKIVKRGKRRYNGVTVKIGKQSRELVPNAFIGKAKSGKSLVLARLSSSRYPIKSVKYEGIYAVANSKKPELKSFTQSEYKALFSKQLKYELS